MGPPLAGKTALIWDERFLEYNLGPNHPLRPIRVKLTHDLIKSKRVIDDRSVKLEKARVASRAELLLFHSEEYLRLVEKYSKNGTGFLDQGDTPAFKGCFEATSLVVGASLQACDLVMKGEYSHAFNPSGGLHHAHRDRASGFCIFNDPAVSIAYLKKNHAVRRLVYLDIDAHHGDGVMYGFYDDPDVLDIDFHESGRFLFPGTGFPDETGSGEARGLKVNIPLPPGTGDEAYLHGFHSIVPGLVRKHRPDVILVQCGADGHENDLLAHLRMTTRTYQEIVGTMHDLAHELCNGRMILYGGGGYTLANVPRVWTVAFASLVGSRLDDVLPEEWRKEFREATGEDPPDHLFDPPAAEDTSQTMGLVEAILEELDETIGWKPAGV